MTAQIKIDFKTPQTISCEVILENKILKEDQFISDSPDINLYALFVWIYSCAKELYYLPSESESEQKVEFLFNNSLNYPEGIKGNIEKIVNSINNTRNEISKLKQAHHIAKDYDGKLFLNLGETPYLYQLYQKAYELNPARSFHDPCIVVNKQPGCDTLPKPTVQNLIQEITEKRIGTIFGHNTSYLTYFLEKNQVYLPAILEHLGVEYVIVDFDTYNQWDGHYYIKSLLNHSSRHFCIMPHIESYWDKKLNLKNIIYFPIPYKINNQETKIISNDYDIVVTTWSRLDKILYYLKPILFFLQYIDLKKPFYDYQFLFHSMVHILLYETNLSHYEKMMHYKNFSQIYYQMNSLFKFEILEGLKTKRKIHLFGDDKWSTFFPEYYEGPLKDNAVKDFKYILDGKPILHLLMNSNYSYFENNPMMIRVFNAQSPYLNFSSVVRTQELDDLKILEYASLDELNSKIELVDTLISKEGYKKSKDNLATSMNDCVENFFTQFTSKKQLQKNTFLDITQKHQAFFFEKLNSYLHDNMSRVHECMLGIIKKEYKNFNIYTNAYLDRPYIKKIISFFEQVENKINTINQIDTTI